MVSGSAALPVSTLEQWRQLTGHTPARALRDDRARHGPVQHARPPGARARRRSDAGRPGAPRRRGRRSGPRRSAWGVAGARVAGVRRLLGTPEATAEAFVDGWFRTGDVGVHEPGGYRLLGRSSVDIIKTGGEKVSALEIEEVYRTHPGIADCAVVGLDDIEWGQRVALAAVPALDALPDGDALRAWGKQRLAAAKVPTRFAFVEELPRNTLGKVVKSEVVKLFS